MTTKKTPFPAPGLKFFIFCAVVFAFFSVYNLWTSHTLKQQEKMRAALSTIKSQEEIVMISGQYGDSYGSLNTLFSGLAFIALTATLAAQMYQLYLTRKEAAKSEEQHNVNLKIECTKIILEEEIRHREAKAQELNGVITEVFTGEITPLPIPITDDSFGGLRGEIEKNAGIFQNLHPSDCPSDALFNCMEMYTSLLFTSQRIKLLRLYLTKLSKIRFEGSGPSINIAAVEDRGIINIKTKLLVQDYCEGAIKHSTWFPNLYKIAQRDIKNFEQMNQQNIKTNNLSAEMED